MTLRLLLFALFPLLAGAAGNPAGEPGEAVRSMPLAVASSGRHGFVRLSGEETGVLFTNYVSEARHLTNQIILNGSGVAAGDMDGDGWCDLFFSGLGGQSRLYRNLGQWRFKDVTADSGVDCTPLDTSGAVFADVDGDGDLDLLISSYGGGTRVFLNNGQGRFTESVPGAGVLNAGRCGLSMALADMDGDGDLDLYQANYRLVTLRDEPNTRFSIKVIEGRPQVVAIDGKPLTDPAYTNRFVFRISMEGGKGRFASEEQGEPDVLFQNDGAGRFSAVPFTGGAFLDEQGRPFTEPLFDWGQSVQFRDLTGDGAPDLYLCDDFRSEDRIWVNDGRGRFRAIAPLAIRTTCLSSMGLDVADINRDGHYDILVTDMFSPEHARRQSQRIDMAPEVLAPGAIDNRPQYPRNTLQLGRGDGTFAEVAQFSGLEATDWTWTPIFLDVDLDGYEDALISNGFERDGMHVDTLQRLAVLKRQPDLSSLEQLRLRKLFPRLTTPSLAYRNLGSLRFADVTREWGFGVEAVSQGMALADFDNDGDLDVVINNFNAQATLLRNESGALRVAVRLKGRPPNTRGIGAQIRLFGGPVPMQMQEMICAGRYLSADEPLRVFAAGSPTNRLRLEVTWRNGQQSVVNDVQPNHRYEITEPAPRPLPLGPPLPGLAPWFTDATALLNHVHPEDLFDDFARQPMLSKRLSQLGPGVTWFDLDGDGWDDLIVASGKGGRMAAFRNNGRGGFESVPRPPFDMPVPRDQTAVLGMRRADGRAVLVAGSANYQDGLTNGSVARLLDVAAGTIDESLPGAASSTGPIALADYDGDDDLDLFVGGRVVPGRYPEPASSLLFRQVSGSFLLDAENSARFAGVGLVSGACFTDLDGNGLPELALACEWGPLRIFGNENGKFTARDWKVSLAEASSTLDPRPSTLNDLAGWWNGVAAGDFDGDGRVDLLAANWGGNTRYERFRQYPLRAYWGDLDGEGTVEVIEGYFLPSARKWMPIQQFNIPGMAMPLVREAVGTWDRYASMSLDEIYGEPLKTARIVEANHLESTLFLNRGDRFEVRVLPAEAQLAPAFAVGVADFDGDGFEDAFLSQNYFAVHPDVSRYDAGRGLVLRGDGRGRLAPVPGQESGVLVYGEQRGAAMSDFDGDGRVDLAVSQNAAATRLLRNTGARPGLRIRLAGPPGNQDAIGAAVRLVTPQGPGPTREIHAGSGYWSQNSATVVMASPVPLQSVWVRWPGGRETTSAVPTGAKEIIIEASGKVRNGP